MSKRKQKKALANRPQQTAPKSEPSVVQAQAEPQAEARKLPEPIRHSVATAPATAAHAASRTPPAAATGRASPRDSLELIRLTAALPLVREMAVTDRADFRRAAEEAPFLLRSLGLGAGLSTLAAKGKGRLRLAEMLADWLLRGCGHSPLRGRSGASTVVDALGAIAGADRATYRSAQIESVGYATCLKRLAQALCPKDSE